MPPLPAASSTAALLLFAAIPRAPGFPVHGQQTVLPVETELNEDALSQPREIFKSEAIGGAKSYLVNLGDLAFTGVAPAP